ncbi:uncharacterized protein LOC135209790 [Macrobrachium nipponense]|uniref:uncharacterized protein LOC135209790 n=1 Tax=Macrobrachium nipponense TaxID=159736 RepID=UPI0030C89C3F
MPSLRSARDARRMPAARPGPTADARPLTLGGRLPARPGTRPRRTPAPPIPGRSAGTPARPSRDSRRTPAARSHWRDAAAELPAVPAPPSRGRSVPTRLPSPGCSADACPPGARGSPGTLGGHLPARVNNSYPLPIIQKLMVPTWKVPPDIEKYADKVTAPTPMSAPPTPKNISTTKVITQTPTPPLVPVLLVEARTRTEASPVPRMDIEMQTEELPLCPNRSTQTEPIVVGEEIADNLFTFLEFGAYIVKAVREASIMEINTLINDLFNDAKKIRDGTPR